MALAEALHALADIESGACASDHESLTLEFKRAQDSFEDTAKSLAEAVACFANSRGGTIVVGVDDKRGGPSGLLGCPYEVERVRRRIWEIVSPSLAVTITPKRIGEVDLLLIEVPEGLEVHMVGGRASHRVGTSCEPMSSSTQTRVVEARRGIDWSAEVTEVPTTSVSSSALSFARVLLERHPDDQRQRYGTLSDADLLRTLGVVGPSGHLLQAGLLLFGDAPGSDLITYQYRRSPGGEPADIQRLGRPLLLSFQRVLDVLAARNEKTPILLPTGQQIELADLPESPVREAIANAIAHRDWRLHEPISIEHAPTRLVVISPGPLVSGVTVENILAHPSKPRNRVLTEAIRKLGLAEQAGVGIDRMYRDMIRSGHQPPEINESDHVRVSLSGGAPNRSLARYVATLPYLVADDVDAMLVLFTLLTQRTTAAEAMAPILQKPVSESASVLSTLAADDVGMLEPTRTTARRRNPTYRLREGAIRELGTAVRHRRRTADEIDRKVIATVRELGQITNGVVQALFDVKVERASRILADLVDRQILVKTSPNERGPRVTYGPGPKFPSRGRGRKRSPDGNTDPIGSDQLPLI